MNEFRKKWTQKTHDIPIQAELDDVKDAVHELDERLDTYEDAEGNPKEKAVVQKPGPSIHSSKWDDCVKEVESKGSAGNAYAVCTAQLGEESFKSEFKHLAKSEIKKAKHKLLKVGVVDAGHIPNSLLADQDLEPDEASDESLYTIENQADALADAGISQQDKTDDEEELANRIKSTQLKRQKATIDERSEKSFKSFWRSNQKK